MADSKTVFVIGAGFTKAFAPDAPLLVDDYGVCGIKKQFESFPTALSIAIVESLSGGITTLPSTSCSVSYRINPP